MAKTPGSETVTVIRKIKVDRLSDDAIGPPAEVDIEGCVILPRVSAETDKGWVVVEGKMVVAPFKSDVLATDQVRYDGDLYEVDGAVGDYRNKRGRGKVTIFYLTRQGRGT